MNNTHPFNLSRSILQVPNQQAYLKRLTCDKLIVDFPWLSPVTVSGLHCHDQSPDRIVFPDHSCQRAQEDRTCILDVSHFHL